MKQLLTMNTKQAKARLSWCTFAIVLVVHPCFALLGVLFSGVLRVLGKWVEFAWNDHDMVRFRHSIWRTRALLTRELQLTLKGSYRRRVLAGYAFSEYNHGGMAPLVAFLRSRKADASTNVLKKMKEERKHIYSPLY